MIISRGRRYIFVHRPKTGGTSLTAALEARAMKDDILIGDTPKALRRRRRLKELPAAGKLRKHATLSDIVGVVSEDEIRDWFVATLVRNPWDRYVSYYHWLRAQRFRHPAVTLAADTTFSEFLSAPATRAGFARDTAFHYVAGPDGHERCDAYLRLEHLAEDLAPFEAHLGFSIGPIGHLNASTRPLDYRSSYTSSDADLIARAFAEEIARFGYDFDAGPPAAR